VFALQTNLPGRIPAAAERSLGVPRIEGRAELAGDTQRQSRDGHRGIDRRIERRQGAEAVRLEHLEIPQLPDVDQHSFPRLLDNYRKRQTRSYRTFAFLLLDHVGGINTPFHILTSGGTVVSPSERTPEAICSAIQRHAVELLPTTPTFLRMLLISENYKKFDLRSLRLVTYGTEPMPAATLEALHRALPGVRLKQTYGLKEVGILPTRSESDESLWLAVGGEGYETKIVDRELWIRTPSAMLGYLNAPSPFDEQGWLNTGDLVERRGDYIRILGRNSEVINVGGEKVFSAEIESFIQQLKNIKDVAVRGRPNLVTGSVVVARVELVNPDDPEEVERRVRAACREFLAPFKVPAMVEVAAGSLCGAPIRPDRRAGEQHGRGDGRSADAAARVGHPSPNRAQSGMHRVSQQGLPEGDVRPTVRFDCERFLGERPARVRRGLGVQCHQGSADRADHELGRRNRSCRRASQLRGPRLLRERNDRWPDCGATGADRPAHSAEATGDRRRRGRPGPIPGFDRRGVHHGPGHRGGRRLDVLVWETQMDSRNEIVCGVIRSVAQADVEADRLVLSEAGTCCRPPWIKMV
jgi:hypothetical protein